MNSVTRSRSLKPGCSGSTARSLPWAARTSSADSNGTAGGAVRVVVISDHLQQRVEGLDGGGQLVGQVEQALVHFLELLAGRGLQPLEEVLGGRRVFRRFPPLRQGERVGGRVDGRSGRAN